MIYVSDKQAAREAMMQPADRKLALEMAEPAVPDDEAPHASLRSRLQFQPRIASPTPSVAG